MEVNLYPWTLDKNKEWANKYNFTIKELLEDVCDNIFNPDPFFQQGGDMVRVGGLSYTCHPKNKMGKRISNLKIVKF